MDFRRFVPAVLLLAACGRSDTRAPNRSVTGSVRVTATGGRAPAECSVLADAIASQLATGRSVVGVRFDYRTRRPLGFAQVHSYGRCSFSTEVRARLCAKEDASAKLPFDPVVQGTRLGAKSLDRGPWVFYQSPREGGGVIVLDDEFGTIFSASTLRDGLGDISTPAAWSTKDLGTGCGAAKVGATSPPAYDLRSGTGMSAAEASTVAKLAEQTVLFGIWEGRGGGAEVFLVMLYPRTAGDAEAQAAEYVVFMRGWPAGG